jgi:MYXO-CTERM domain-containing protein
VLFNARPDAATFADDAFKGAAYELHPLQQNSVDVVVKTAAFDAISGAFTVPGRTTAVFVIKRAVVAPPTKAAVTPTPNTVMLPSVSGGSNQSVPTQSATSSPALLGGIAVIVLAALAGLWAWLRRKK